MNVSKYRDLYIHLQFILYTVAPLEIGYMVLVGPLGVRGLEWLKLGSLGDRLYLEFGTHSDPSDDGLGTLSWKCSIPPFSLIFSII